MTLTDEQLDKLTALGKLKDSGALTDAEFDAERKAIMDAAAAPEPDNELLREIRREEANKPPSKWPGRIGILVGLILIPVVITLRDDAWHFVGGDYISESALEQSMQEEFSASAVNCVKQADNGSQWSCLDGGEQESWSVAVKSDGEWIATPR